MKLNRRDFVGSLLGVPLAAAAAAPFAARAEGFHPMMVMIDGIAADTPAERLFSFLDPIISQGIPVCCLIALQAPGGEWLAPDSGLAALLRRLQADYSGLVELVPQVTGLAQRPGYARMRLASAAQTAFRRVSGGAGSLTLASDQPEDDVPVVSGLRVAGFRNLLLVPATAAAPEVWDNADGVTQIFGGQRAPGGLSADGDAAALIYAALPRVTTTEAFAQGVALGDAIAQRIAMGGRYLTLPRDFHLQSGESYARHIALCLVQRGDTAEMDRLATALTQAGIAFSRLATGDGGADSGLLCRTGGADDPLICLAADLVDDGRIKMANGAGFDLFLAAPPGRGATVGLTDYGVLVIADTLAAGAPEQLQQALGILRDRAVLVTPEALSVPGATQALSERLMQLAQDRNTRFVTLAGHAAAVMARDEPFELLKRSDRQASHALVPAGSNEAALREDAALAWRYIEKLTDDTTGLVPATAWMEGDALITYPFATMWDTGSLFLALVSAHRLGLIGDAEFLQRCRKALGHLADVRYQGVLLPKGLSSTRGTSDGRDTYSASDAARLLTAFHVLDAYVPDDLGLADIVARWEFDRTLREGRVLTAGNGGFIDAYGSNYANYIARGFRLWGFEAALPYADMPEAAGYDARVALLYQAADAGPIGAEPHLLEEMELGISGPARVMAEALYGAQLASHAATGRLVCVSEGPLDRAPWFTYQGYQIDGGAAPWVIETIGTDPQYQTPGFLRSTQSLSTKAAFLWAAVRGDGYAERLLAVMRDKARVPGLGFSSGVFEGTGLAMQNYSDLNTNAVILQAIGYALNGNTPARNWR